MRRRCSDRRLERLVKKALYALEDPGKGILFDDFDTRYREAERKREADAARWYYRDKTSFEVKYEEACGRDPCNEPAWVSDRGRGAAAVRRGTGAGLAQDWREKRRRAALAKARRISPTLARTLGLIIKNGSNRKESIGALMTGSSWHQAEVLYYRHRAALIRVFGRTEDEGQRTEANGES